MKTSIRHALLGTLAVVLPLAALGSPQASTAADAPAPASTPAAHPYRPGLDGMTLTHPRGGATMTINTLDGSYSDAGALTVTGVTLESSRVLQGTSTQPAPTFTWTAAGLLKVTFADVGSANSVRQAAFAVTAKDGVGQVATSTVVVTDEVPWSNVRAADMAVDFSQGPASSPGVMEYLPLDGSAVGQIGTRYEIEIVTPPATGKTVGGGWREEQQPGLRQFHVDNLGLRYIAGIDTQAGDTDSFRFRFRNGDQVSNVATATVISRAHLTYPR